MRFVYKMICIVITRTCILIIMLDNDEILVSNLLPRTEFLLQQISSCSMQYAMHLVYFLSVGWIFVQNNIFSGYQTVRGLID